ncbi:hypothetical protein FSARC_2543 [Fusarium sarcochroum]|uniref:GST C-terminal domain-containing protein n=1 Tax=Fusarium sarcochroum TaxID=1208366 RepID=A0A8H4U5Z0_9HYPO|nr:hypothetical protein FSARC_2543 [Fusarium sarcochroum]
MGSTTQSSDMPNLTLYRLNGSCAIVPHAILRHYKILFEATRLKFGPYGVEAADGSFTHAQYRSIHPKGRVPALAVDEEIITEMPAVINYISSLIPNENLLGVTALERAKVTEWLAFLSGTLHALGLGALRRPGWFSDDTAAHEGIRAKGKELAVESYKRIEKGLKGREFAVGHALTAVDFNLYIFARWAEDVDIDLKTECPAFYEHSRRTEKLKGVQEAVKNEELKFVFV